MQAVGKRSVNSSTSLNPTIFAHFLPKQQIDYDFSRYVENTLRKAQAKPD
jgi:hypothetical protein